jgi:hypothetical protein
VLNYIELYGEGRQGTVTLQMTAVKAGRRGGCRRQREDHGPESKAVKLSAKSRDTDKMSRGRSNLRTRASFLLKMHSQQATEFLHISEPSLVLFIKSSIIFRYP